MTSASLGWALLLIVWATAAPAIHAATPTFPLVWRWSNPTPHGNNVVDMAWNVTLNRAVQVTDQGQIYTSDDLILWIPRHSGTSDALRGVTFFQERIIVTGENGRVLYGDSADQFQLGTLLDGSTDDWLEGVAASPNLIVAVGDNGAIYSSASGQSWKRQPNANPEWLRGVAYGNGVFVAVGESGRVLTSGNGTNWTRRSSNTSANLNRVSYSPGRFTAVGNSGVVISSLNAGVNWTLENCGATNNLYYVTATQNRLVLGAEEVRLHENGVWSNELIKGPAPPIWTYYSAIARPNYFLIAGQTGMLAEGNKTNGTSYFWRPSSDSVRHWLFDGVHVGNVYVAVGDIASIMTSVDGIRWDLELPPAAVTNTTFLGVGGTTNLLVAVGDAGAVAISPAVTVPGSETNQAGPTTSPGVVWTAVTPRPTTNTLQGVAYFNGRYVISGARGTILTSPDGTTWSPVASGTTNFISGLAAGPGRIVATGDRGTLLSSLDGLSWTVLPSATTNWLYRARYLNGRFISCGENGIVLTSVDGLSWSLIPAGTAKNLYDVTFAADTYFIAGAGGTLRSSPDAQQWTDRGTITKKDLFSAMTDSQQLVVAGSEGIILRSQLLPNPTPIDILAYSRVVLANGLIAQNVFLFGGQPDQQFTLDYRSDLTTNLWTIGPMLEFLDSSGTLYYVESIGAGQSPPLEFYRATLLQKLR